MTVSELKSDQRRGLESIKTAHCLDESGFSSEQILERVVWPCRLVTGSGIAVRKSDKVAKLTGRGRLPYYRSKRHLPVANHSRLRTKFFDKSFDPFPVFDCAI